MRAAPLVRRDRTPSPHTRIHENLYSTVSASPDTFQQRSSSRTPQMHQVLSHSPPSALQLWMGKLHCSPPMYNGVLMFLGRNRSERQRSRVSVVDDDGDQIQSADEDLFMSIGNAWEEGAITTVLLNVVRISFSLITIWTVMSRFLSTATLHLVPIVGILALTFSAGGQEGCLVFLGALLGYLLTRCCVVVTVVGHLWRQESEGSGLWDWTTSYGRSTLVSIMLLFAGLSVAMMALWALAVSVIASHSLIVQCASKFVYCSPLYTIPLIGSQWVTYQLHKNFDDVPTCLTAAVLPVVGAAVTTTAFLYNTHDVVALAGFKGVVLSVVVVTWLDFIMRLFSLRYVPRLVAAVISRDDGESAAPAFAPDDVGRLPTPQESPSAIIAEAARCIRRGFLCTLSCCVESLVQVIPIGIAIGTLGTFVATIVTVVVLSNVIISSIGGSWSTALAANVIDSTLSPHSATVSSPTQQHWHRLLDGYRIVFAFTFSLSTCISLIAWFGLVSHAMGSYEAAPTWLPQVFMLCIIGDNLMSVSRGFFHSMNRIGESYGMQAVCLGVLCPLFVGVLNAALPVDDIRCVIMGQVIGYWAAAPMIFWFVSMEHTEFQTTRADSHNTLNEFHDSGDDFANHHFASGHGILKAHAAGELPPLANGRRHTVTFVEDSVALACPPPLPVEKQQGRIPTPRDEDMEEVRIDDSLDDGPPTLANTRNATAEFKDSSS